MVKLFFAVVILICYTGVAHAKPVSYEHPRLQTMPRLDQQIFEDSFRRLSLGRSFVGVEGSSFLGINMLFIDDFYTTSVAVKYNVKGNFKLGKVYHHKDLKSYHFKYKDVNVAIFYQNIGDSSIRILEKLVGKMSAKRTTFIPRIISEAQADTCYKPDISADVPIDTEVGEMSTGALITKCFSGLGSGAEDATVGVVRDGWDMMKGAWGALSAEAKRFYDAPMARLNDYGEFLGKGLAVLKDFSLTVGKMLINPVYGAKILKEKFGEMGEFFAQAYQNIKDMPTEAKVDIICNIIGSIGTDVLIAALTVGAASGKLGVGVARLMLKLRKITSLIGKGITYPFKLMNKLSESALEGMSKIIKAGKESLLRSRMKGLGCAI